MSSQMVSGSLPQPISWKDRTTYVRPASLTCPDVGRRTRAPAPSDVRTCPLVPRTTTSAPVTLWTSFTKPVTSWIDTSSVPRRRPCNPKTRRAGADDEYPVAVFYGVDEHPRSTDHADACHMGEVIARARQLGVRLGLSPGQIAPAKGVQQDAVAGNARSFSEELRPLGLTVVDPLRDVDNRVDGALAMTSQLHRCLDCGGRGRWDRADRCVIGPSRGRRRRLGGRVRRRCRAASGEHDPEDGYRDNCRAAPRRPSERSVAGHAARLGTHT